MVVQPMLSYVEELERSNMLLRKQAQTRDKRDQERLALTDRQRRIIAHLERCFHYEILVQERPTQWLTKDEKAYLQIILRMVMIERKRTHQNGYVSIDMVEIHARTGMNTRIDQTSKSVRKLLSMGLLLYFDGDIAGEIVVAIPDDFEHRLTHVDNKFKRPSHPATTMWCAQCGRMERVKYVSPEWKIATCETAGHLLAPAEAQLYEMFMGKGKVTPISTDQALAILKRYGVKL